MYLQVLQTLTGDDCPADSPVRVFEVVADNQRLCRVRASL